MREAPNGRHAWRAARGRRAGRPNRAGGEGGPPGSPRARNGGGVCGGLRRHAPLLLFGAALLGLVIKLQTSSDGGFFLMQEVSQSSPTDDGDSSGVSSPAARAKKGPRIKGAAKRAKPRKKKKKAPKTAPPNIAPSKKKAPKKAVSKGVSKAATVGDSSKKKKKQRTSWFSRVRISCFPNEVGTAFRLREGREIRRSRAPPDCVERPKKTDWLCPLSLPLPLSPLLSPSHRVTASNFRPRLRPRPRRFEPRHVAPHSASRAAGSFRAARATRASAAAASRARRAPARRFPRDRS